MAREDKEAVKEKVEITPADRPAFFWEAVEFESHEKSRGWFAYLIIAAVILAAAFIYLKLWLAVAVVVAATFALGSQAHSSGKKKNYAIYNQGVTIDNRVYTFDQFKSFWIFPYQDRVVIRFEQLRRFSLPVEMPIETENPDQIRLFLAKHLPEEEEKGEDVMDTINRWIKF